MTIPKSIRFTATVSKEGTIQLPEGAVPEGTTVEVVLNPTVEESENKITAMEFVEKFRGFLKGAENEHLDDARYQRILNKHVK